MYLGLITTNAVALNAAAPELVAELNKISITKFFSAFRAVIVTASTQMIGKGLDDDKNGRKEGGRDVRKVITDEDIQQVLAALGIAIFVKSAALGIIAGIIVGSVISGINKALEDKRISDSFAKSLPKCVLSWVPSHARRHDPLVLDLNGDGVKLTSLDGSKVNFDFGGDGFAEKTGWVSAQDGLLTLDKNNNGKIDNGSELFGSAREDGFTALSHYDLNKDGKINASDAVFTKLRVWRDANANGVTDKGELLTLAQAGVKDISLEKKASGIDNAGNRIDFTGSFTRTDGATGDSVAVSFAINQTLTKWTPPAGFKISAEAEKLPGQLQLAA